MIVGIVKVFKTVISAIVKVAAWLLFILGLWLPCLYCLVFLLVCAFSGASLSSLLQPFIVGIILSAIVGFAISYYADKRKKKREKVVKQSRKDALPSREPKKKKAGPEPETPEEPYLNGDFAAAEYPSGDRARFDEFASGAEEEKPQERADDEPPRPVYDFATEARLREKIFEDESKSRLDDVGYDYDAALERKTSRLSERPLVFRTRRDKDVFIYEYSDCLQIYRRTGGGMKLTEIVPKQKSKPS